MSWKMDSPGGEHSAATPLSADAAALLWLPRSQGDASKLHAVCPGALCDALRAVASWKHSDHGWEACIMVVMHLDDTVPRHL